MIEKLIENYHFISWLKWLPEYLGYFLIITFFTLILMLYIFSVSILSFIIDKKLRSSFLHTFSIRDFWQDISHLKNGIKHLFPLYLILISIVILYSILPFCKGFFGVHLQNSVFFFLIVLSSTILGFLILSLSLENQTVIIELMSLSSQLFLVLFLLFISSISIFITSGSCDFFHIIQSQSGYSHIILPNWFIFNSIFTFISFVIYFVACICIVQLLNFNNKYRELRGSENILFHGIGLEPIILALFKYAIIYIIFAFGVTLFLGGWHTPIKGIRLLDGSFAGLIWFILKTFFIYYLALKSIYHIPVLSANQFYKISFKYLIPIGLVAGFGSGILRIF